MVVWDTKLVVWDAKLVTVVMVGGVLVVGLHQTKIRKQAEMAVPFS